MKELTWPGKRGKSWIVDDKYNWLTWDADGEACAHDVEPYPGLGGSWGTFIGNISHVGDGIKPPEVGPWYEQIYWIGDE